MPIQSSKNSVSHKVQLPTISRFITERVKPRLGLYLKIGLFSVITTFLLVSIILKGYQYLQISQTLQIEAAHRQALLTEQAYWEDVATRHTGYRDAYFKLAVLSYQLGNKAKTKEYLLKTFSIDPNFKEGRAFAGKVGL